MGRWNFNVTIPLFDFLLGTIAPSELAERAERDEAFPPDARGARPVNARRPA